MVNVIHTPSPNYDDRNASVDMLILHYTDILTAQEALDRLRDPAAKVSAHYLISKEGVIYKMVEDRHRAWHAGVSHWQDREGLNHHSIGIELDNPGHRNEYVPFPMAQMTSLVTLIHDIRSRWRIPNQHILGHSDIAVGRKLDPGELFDWKWLASQGIGIYPPLEYQGAQVISDTQALGLLKEIGYRFKDTHIREVVYAFQQHFFPQNLTGDLDDLTKSRIFQVHKGFIASVR